MHLWLAMILVLSAGLRWLLPVCQAAQCQGSWNQTGESWSDYFNSIMLGHSFSRTVEHGIVHAARGNCPMGPPSPPRDRYFRNFAMCPWTSEINFDPDRFPQEISFARCTCSDCSETFLRIRSSLPRRCFPVFHTYHVIRRSCTAGNYTYNFAFERLPVACVCMHRIIEIMPSM